MKLLLFLSLLLGYTQGFAKQQKQPTSILIKYVSPKESEEDSSPLFLLYQNYLTTIYRQNETTNSSLPIAEEITFINYKDSTLVKKATLKEKNKIHYSTPLTKLYDFKLTNEYKKILGYKCRKATRVSFSNRIDVWFTTQIKANGSPIPNYGLTKGIILRIDRNGNTLLVASSIKKKNKEKPSHLAYKNLGKLVSNNEYRYLIRENYVTRINVFKDEQIAWNNPKPNKEDKKNNIYRLNNGTLILKKIKLPNVSSDYMVFIKATQYSNGDAYDRTGTIFLIPNQKEISALDTFIGGKETKPLPIFKDSKGNQYKGITSNETYECPIELMRFFTPFGIKKYNERVQIPNLTWRNKAIYKQDITHLLPYLKGEVWIGATIGNYDKGGHKLSVELAYFPTEKKKSNSPTRKFVKPLFNNAAGIPGQGGVNLFANDSLKCTFTIPSNVKNLRMMYITTGHGGWGGGDEFNQKTNTVYIDSKKVFVFIPWRTDCATYRDLNPASGNFWNGVSSSDYSRSNWAPGTTTNPIVVPLPHLKPGKHTLTISIPQGPEGCAWNVSGVLIGEYETQKK